MSTMIETKDLRFAYPVEEGEEQIAVRMRKITFKER